MILQSIPNPRLTPLQAWEHVRQHLLEQGCHSSCDGIYTYRYRGDGGTACAAGCLIPDELYDESMEGNAASSDLTIIEALLAVIDTGPDSQNNVRLENGAAVYFGEWLDALQRVHDTANAQTFENDVAQGLNLLKPEA